MGVCDRAIRQAPSACPVKCANQASATAFEMLTDDLRLPTVKPLTAPRFSELELSDWRNVKDNELADQTTKLDIDTSAK